MSNDIRPIRYTIDMYQDLIDYKNGTTEQAKIYPEFIPQLSDATVDVYYGKAAEGTNSSTSSVLEYGINVFTIASGTDYAAKLPQPVTGRSTKIVNLTNVVIFLYPSNIGGQINNYAVDTPALVPPDGRVYEFFCVENPLPGAWTWSAPAVGQYDSGVITATTTGNTDHISAANSTSGYGIFGGFFSTSGWCYDGKNNPIIFNTVIPPSPLWPAGGTVIAFKPTSPWSAITKIKVYTNYITNGSPIFGLMYANQPTYYDPATGDVVNAGPGGGNNYGPYGYLTNVVNGTPGAGPLSANVGDPGTRWGEIVLNPNSTQIYSQVGDIYQGQIPYPYGSTPPIVDSWLSGYVCFMIRPGAALVDFKYQFFLEYI